MSRDGRSLLRYCLVLIVCLAAACRRGTATPTPTPTVPLPMPTVTSVPRAPTPTPVVYVVQPGDSLSAIAVKFGVPVEAIAEANDIQDADVIKAGQKLIIPGPTPIPVPTVPPTMTPTRDIPPQLEIMDVIGRGAPAAEMVIIANRGRGVSLHQWTLRDEQGNNIFVFPNLYLGAGGQVRVHTGAGENTPLHVYWNRETAVWGEPGDAVILADERGVIYARKALD